MAKYITEPQKISILTFYCNALTECSLCSYKNNVTTSGPFTKPNGTFFRVQCLFILKLPYPGNRIKITSNYTYFVIIKHFEVRKSEEPFQ